MRLRRIGVFRALQLGDLLCAVPAFRSLRALFPSAEITLIGLPWARTFVDRFPHYLNRFLEFPGFPGFPERHLSLSDVPPFLERVQRKNFDLVLQMHGSGQLSNPLVALMGARKMAGFFSPGEFCPDPKRFLPYPFLETEVRRQLLFLKFLGAPAREEHLEFPLREADKKVLSNHETLRLLSKSPYVCLHAGSRSPERRWAPECFAAVGDRLAGLGYKVVLTGSSWESEINLRVQTKMTEEAIDTGLLDLPLGPLAALLKQSRMVVCNDTGVSHLAAALDVPSVVAFVNSDPDRWAPKNKKRHCAVQVSQRGGTEKVLLAAERLLLLV